jgi:hypothetical protein
VCREIAVERRAVVESKEIDVGLIVSEAAQAAFSGDSITPPTNYKLEDIKDSARTLCIRGVAPCFPGVTTCRSRSQPHRTT